MATLPNATAVRLGATVVGAALMLSPMLGVLIGVVPASMLGRLDMNQVLTVLSDRALQRDR